MNRFYYDRKCICKEEEEERKKEKEEFEWKPIKRSKGKPLPYPQREGNQATPQIHKFQIKFEKKLSALGKNILNNFQNKYIYYAIDDILYLLKANPKEQENLLSILYSAMFSLQNNFSINFFDIWIQEIYIEETSNINKFLKKDFQNLKAISYITINFVYKTRMPIKKIESLW